MLKPIAEGFANSPTPYPLLTYVGRSTHVVLVVESKNSAAEKLTLGQVRGLQQHAADAASRCLR